MNIVYQGRTVETDCATLGEFLSSMKVDASHAVTEFNGDILPPGSGADRVLSSGDRIDVFRIVGGG